MHLEGKGALPLPSVYRILFEGTKIVRERRVLPCTGLGPSQFSGSDEDWTFFVYLPSVIRSAHCPHHHHHRVVIFGLFLLSGALAWCLEPEPPDGGACPTELCSLPQVISGPTFHVSLRAVVIMPSLCISNNNLEFTAVQCGMCQVDTIQLHNQLQVTCEWFATSTEQMKKVPGGDGGKGGAASHLPSLASFGL